MSASTGDPRLVEGGFAAIVIPAFDDASECTFDLGTPVRLLQLDPGGGAFVVSTSKGRRELVPAQFLAPVDADYARAWGWRAFDPDVYTRGERALQGAFLVVLAACSLTVVAIGVAALVGLIP